MVRLGKKNKTQELATSVPAPEPKKPVRVVEVFTPSVPASRGFVGRKREMKDLRNGGLRVPGTQVVVWGESGAGKSSLINKALVDEGLVAVKTSCTPDSTYEQVLAAAFAGTGAFYVAETTEHTDVNLSVGSVVGSELIGAKVTATAELSTGEGVKREPITKPQLSPQRLVAELGKRNYSWVIEDFHKMEKSERSKIAHALKVFSDEGGKYVSTRVIVLGVSESVDELVTDATNVKNRLVDIHVAPLDHNELGKILDVGESLLNLDFSNVRARLLNTAVGTASIAHALALACCNERDVTQAVQERVVFTEGDYQEAAQSYVRTRSGGVKARFTSALKVHRKRMYDNTEIILRALTQLPESGGTVGEILSIIRREKPKYPSSNATKYLLELQEEKRGALIRKSSSGVYRFDEPLQHAYAKAYFDDSSGAGKWEPTSDWESALIAEGKAFVSWSIVRGEIESNRDSMTDDEPTEEWKLEEGEFEV
ncbi:hypothetical protein SRABI98_00766 [Microbacterium sp. Bi98]|uniref:ATP-binding protein n=1 Tax=Microbacterium sp. Bi98 TaxID=2821116 RepID=UPI001D43FE1B|nr:ATP-binding protein [Microbacterium sp. Bi98]CAH0150565.1 hypothetical protein SRABI98_00766 [Microbacterium sp. Bi98]